MIVTANPPPRRGTPIAAPAAPADARSRFAALLAAEQPSAAPATLRTTAQVFNEHGFFTPTASAEAPVEAPVEAATRDTATIDDIAVAATTPVALLPREGSEPVAAIAAHATMSSPAPARFSHPAPHGSAAHGATLSLTSVAAHAKPVARDEAAKPVRTPTRARAAPPAAAALAVSVQVLADGIHVHARLPGLDDAGRASLDGQIAALIARHGHRVAGVTLVGPRHPAQDQ
ncbi:MAG TPA: hypothetical protein VFQ57_00915 [Sphingomonas sp.]|jgi:hypothetical protein|nr:hypothetical protein [Sphingomonas sp.]